MNITSDSGWVNLHTSRPTYVNQVRTVVFSPDTAVEEIREWAKGLQRRGGGQEETCVLYVETRTVIMNYVCDSGD